MPSLGLNGPHALTEKDIDGAVVGLGPGVYALGQAMLDRFRLPPGSRVSRQIELPRILLRRGR